eukprot:7310696-Karenia_brevis.AAC.1
MEGGGSSGQPPLPIQRSGSTLELIKALARFAQKSLARHWWMSSARIFPMPGSPLTRIVAWLFVKAKTLSRSSLQV